MNLEKFEKLLKKFIKIMVFIGVLIVVIPIIGIIGSFDLLGDFKPIITNPILLTIILFSYIYSLIECIMNFRKMKPLHFVLKILFYLIVIFIIGFLIFAIVIWLPASCGCGHVNGLKVN